MPKFKKGDRVEIITFDSYVPYGEVGTVVESRVNPDIKWDNYTSNRGSMWAVDESSIKLIDGTPKYEIY